MEFNPLIPELMVSDFQKSLAFYTGVLGFRVEFARENFALISYHGSQMMIQQENNKWETGPMEKPYGRGINLEISTDNANAMSAAIKARGTPLFRGVMENWYEANGRLLGSREFLVQDPDGYLLRFSEDIGEKGA